MAKHKLKIYKIKIMINTKELRLGNLFANIEDDSIYKVTKINEDTIEGICINNMGWIGEQHFHLIEQVLPIKITEEWLLKFGFENIGSTYTIDNDRFEFSFMFYDAWNLYYKEKKGFGCDEINLTGFWNIHQLQNLYFALTGEELTQVSEGKK